MKYVFIYLFYVLTFFITFFLVLIFGLTNACLFIWHFNTNKCITWKRFMRRKFDMKTYLTEIDIKSTYLNMSMISDKGHIYCDKYCNEI